VPVFAFPTNGTDPNSIRPSRPVLDERRAGQNRSVTSAEPDKTAPSPTATSLPGAPKGFVLEDGIPVKLRINRTMSSADAHTGETVDFEVLEDVLINGTLVIPKGGLAFGTVTEAQAKRRMARGGKLDINIDYVRLVSDEKAALRAVQAVKGGGHTGAMTGGIVATSIVFFPAAPLFLFMHGKDITIPKGTEVTAYVSGDMKLDIAKFQPAASAPIVAANASSGTQAHLQLSSTPDGADIEVDGNFAGNTPSDIDVAPGDHMITMKKSGYKDWTKKMKITAGSNIHVHPELEKAAQ
jgi:hypothetical protein